MTTENLRVLQAQILANEACAPFIVTNDDPKDPNYHTKDKAIATIISEGRTRLRSRLITERGVIAALGTVDGEAFLQALEAFTQADLTAEHPLKAHQAGIKRIFGWLRDEAGIELGDPQAQALLATLGALGVVDQAHAELIAAQGREPDPVTPGQVSRALRGPWDDEEA